jgi:sucrose-6-phosphate hydrolase SacC (GH32 family)
LYNVKRGTLSVLNTTVPVVPINNKISIEILLDRASVEVFVNGGQTVISNCFAPTKGAEDLVIYTNGGELGVDKLDVYEMQSIWKPEK